MTLPITWHDGIEILFFSSLFYYLALWLRKDKQQNLLWYFYGYCAVSLIAYNANLPTVNLFLILFSPAIMMLFIIMHQDTLQRNFVALRHITPAKKTTNNWLEALIQTCLIAINKNKAITCILERSDNMHTFLHVPFIIHAPLHTALLEMLLNADSYDQHKMVWIDAHGNLEGINATWRHSITQSCNQDNSEQLHNTPLHDKTTLEKISFEKTHPENTCLEDALLYTTKTDALIFTINPDTRTFTIIMGGNHLQKVSAQHAYSTIQKYLKNGPTTQSAFTTLRRDKQKHPSSSA